MGTGTGVVKGKARGGHKGKARDVATERLWRRRLALQGRSGLSVREFCRQSQLTETAFYHWRRELRRRQAERREGHVSPRRRTPSASPTFGASRGAKLSSCSAASPRRHVRRAVGSFVASVAAGSASPAFVAVRVAEHGGGVVVANGDRPTGGRMEIVLSGGRRVRVSGVVDRVALAEVVAVLEGLPVALAGEASRDGRAVCGREVRPC